MDQIKLWFKSLAPQERVLVTGASVVLALLVLYFGVIRPTAVAVNTREARVERKQQDLTWMRGTADTVRMLAATQPNASTGESLVVLINRTAQQASLGSALTNQTPAGDNSVRVRLEAGNFDSMVTWFSTLERQYAVRVESASIDRTDKLGIVNASVVLTRAIK